MNPLSQAYFLKASIKSKTRSLVTWYSSDQALNPELTYAAYIVIYRYLTSCTIQNEITTNKSTSNV